MTRIQQRQGADAVAGAQRAGRLGRLRWTRALPSGVAMIAALTFPEFSVGAGEFAEGKRQPDPVKPPTTAGQGLIKPAPSATKQPLSGVRYGAMLDIADIKSQPNAQLRSARPAPDAIISDDVRFAPSRPVEASIALAETTTPIAERDAARASLPKSQRAPLAQVSLGKSRIAPVGAVSPDELDAAASYAASVLDGYVAPPGLGAEGSLAASAPGSAPALKTPVAVDALDAAANYTAFVLDSFVPPPAGVQASTGGRDPAPTSVLESGGEDEGAVELVPTPVRPDLAGDPGLTPPPMMAMAAPALATPQAAASPSADLASAASKPAPQAAALAPLPKPTALAPTPGIGADAPFALDIKSQLLTRVDGKAAGAVDFQQTATGLTVRLGSIVDVLGDRYDPAQIARIRASAASNLYLSLADLQAQGIPISYDPVYDEFNVGQTDTRPKAARKVHMDQISTPERGLGTTAMDQVRR